MSRQNTRKSVKLQNTLLTYDEKLILVRDGVYNYLQFIPTTQNKYVINSTITAKPVVVIKNSGTQTVVLDYTNANTENKQILNSLFNNVYPGQTFLFSNAHYVNPLDGTDVELEATLSFKSYKDYIIKTQTVGTTLATPDNNFYDPVYFIDSPTVQFNQINNIEEETENIINELRNAVPTNKTTNQLKYLGIVPGNYIKIINPDSLNNDVLFKVEKINTDTYETITLSPSPEYENLIGDSTLIKVFAQCKNPEAIKDIVYNNIWGCAAIQQGQTLEYFSYFSELQANIKKQEYVNGELQYFANSECAGQATINTNSPVLTLETTTTQDVKVTKMDVVIARNKLFPTIVQVANGISSPRYSVTNNVLSLDVNGTYQFAQSDVSNQGNTLRFSASNTTKQPVYELNGVTNYVTAGGVGTVLLLDAKTYVETTGNTEIYAYSEQNPGLFFTVVFTGQLPVTFRSSINTSTFVPSI